MPLNFSPYKPIEKFAVTNENKDSISDTTKELISYTINFNDDIDKILFQPRYTYLGIQAMGKDYGDFCKKNEVGKVKDETNCARYTIEFLYKNNKNNESVINNFLSNFDNLYNSNINDNNVNYVKIPTKILQDSQKYIKYIRNNTIPNEFLKMNPPVLPQNTNLSQPLKETQQCQPKDGIVEIKEENLKKIKALLLQVKNNSNNTVTRNYGSRQPQYIKYINNINQKNIYEILNLLSSNQ